MRLTRTRTTVVGSVSASCPPQTDASQIRAPGQRQRQKLAQSLAKLSRREAAPPGQASEFGSQTRRANQRGQGPQWRNPSAGNERYEPGRKGRVQIVQDDSYTAERDIPFPT